MSVEDTAAPALSVTKIVAHAAAPLRQVAAATPSAAATASAAEQRRAALLTAPILPTLLKLALPTVTVLVAQTAVNIAEAYYVGFLGTDALAGAALVFPIFMLMTMMSNGGFGSGVASSVARAVGAGRRADAEAALFHAVVLAIIAGGVFTLGVIFGGPHLYRALGGTGEALAAATTYSNYLFAGAIPVWIVNLQAAALRGSGNVKVPALVTLVGAIVTIPVSPALIFGFGPIPRLGIGGAGVAFGLYYGAAMLYLLYYMASGATGLKLHIVPLRGKIFGDMLKVGIPTAFNAVLTNLTVILVTGAVGLFGTSALAGYGIASRLDYIMIPLLFGISTATLTMVGVNMGAGQTARARKIGWISGVVGMIMTGAIGLLVAIFPTAWLNLFNLLPVWQLDGGRGMRALSRPERVAIAVAFVVAWVATHDGLLLLLTIAAAFRAFAGAPGPGDRRICAQFLVLVGALAALSAIRLPELTR